jgi:hypothetical protein
MADRPPEPVVELTDDDEELEPLVPDDTACGEAELDLAFDEFGELMDSRQAIVGPEIGPIKPQLPEIPLVRPCSLTTLNGSWLLQLTPQLPFASPFQEIRGPMRIEAGGGLLRISGDVYVRRIVGGVGTIESPSPVLHKLLIRRNWYPAYPQSQYRWYFRSRGVTYSQGVLSFPFEPT